MADAAPPSLPLPQEWVALRQRVASLEAALAAQHPAAQTLRDATHYANQMVETVRDPLLVLTSDSRVQSANPAFYHLFHVSPLASTLCMSILGGCPLRSKRRSDPKS